MDEKSTYIDELSGVYNRRYLKEKQEQRIKTYISKKTPFSIAWVDIDHFKEINDTYGHLKGDEIIKIFALFLKDTLRASDTVIRYGGDEFICILPNTTRQDAEWTFQRILKNCRQREFSQLNITMSVGVSYFPEDGKNFKDLLNIADVALYDAKRRGRDQIGTKTEKRIDLPIKTFINRVEERERLNRLLSSDSKKMRIAIIKGNVGIGKTRLGKEALNRIKGVEVVWCDCVYFEESLAYYPIREMVKYRIQRWEKGRLKEIPLVYRIEIRKLVPEIMDRIEEETGDIGLVLDKYRLYESVRKVMEMGEKDKVVIVDNIQWIDRDSIETLKYLMRVLKDKSITFLLIYRIEEQTELLENFLSYISREIEALEIELGPFKNNEVKECIKAVIGENPDKELTGYIMHESGGNPFYIEEIIRELFFKKNLLIDVDDWRFKAPEGEIVPKTIEGVAARKYESLNEEEKEVLEIASVIGYFDKNIIKELTGYNEGHILGILENISRLGLIKMQGDTLRFQEEISRNAIYKKFVRGIKEIVIHKKVGDKKEELNKGKEGEIAEELAMHYYHAKEKNKGLRYCIEAGDRSREKYANDDAVRYYTWAIELMEADKEEGNIKISIDCMKKRAAILSFIGENSKALVSLNNALELSNEISDLRRKADIKYRKADICNTLSRYKDALDEARESIGLYAETADRCEVGRAYLVLGSIYFRQGEDKNALKAYEDALKIFESNDDKESEADALNNIGNAYFRLGDFAKALSKHEMSLNIFKEIGNKNGESRVLHSIGNILYASGKYTGALENYTNALEIFREIGNKALESKSLRNIGLVHYNTGDFPKAMNVYKDALKIVQDIGDKNSQAEVLSDIGDIYLNLGDYKNAEMYLENALSISEEIKAYRIKCFTLASLGSLYMALKKINKARKCYEEAHQSAEGSTERLQYTLPGVCNFYLEVGDIKCFEQTMAKIESIFMEKPKNLEGDIDILLGRYNAHIDSYSKASEYFQKALQIFEELKEPLTLGEIYYYRGMMEVKRKAKPAAEKDLNKSLEIFKSLCALGWQEIVEKSLKKHF